MYRNFRLQRRAFLGGILLLATTVATILAIAPAHATTARQFSLGGGDFLEDDHNVQRWYGSLGDYPNLLTIEAGHFTLPEGWHDDNGHRVSGPGIGAHLALDEAGRWGTAAIFLNGQSDDVDPGSLARDRMGTTGSAMWTRRFGSLQPTLMFRHGSDEGEVVINQGIDDSLVRSWDRARTEFGFGLRWDLSEGVYFDLAGEVRRHREQTTVADTMAAVTVVGPEFTSSGSYGLRSRAFVRLGPTTALVPLIEFLHEDRPLAAQSPQVGLQLDGYLLKLGTGLNWYPNPDNFLVLSFDYLHGEADFRSVPTSGEPVFEDSSRWDSASFTLGIESRFAYWLTFRGSIRYEPVELSVLNPVDLQDFATFMVNFGAAVQLGDYDLDLAVTDQEPRSVVGYYGHSLFDNPATWVTASFRKTF